MDAAAALEAYWSQPVEAVTAAVRSSADGLSGDDARQRLTQYGPNALKARERATALGLFLNQFKSPIILILLFATGVSAVLHEWVDAVIVLLTRADLTLVPWLIWLSRRTRRIILQNLGWAFAYNLFSVPLAALGVISPVIAAVTMSISSLLVVGNSLRLRR
jgi:magnesium-transporting ATPase (P-type)